MTVVIVGGGIAGTTCAEELRRLSPTVEIVLISEEHSPLYSRPLLPHYLTGKVPRERVFLKSENWYAENDIEWLAGKRAEKVDVKNFFVLLSDGRELSFDKLVIAGGRHPCLLPEDHRGISYLLTLGDADHLSQLISEQSRPCPVGVYGSGLIACEFVNIFKHFAFDVTVAFRGPHFWPRVLDAESGGLINQHLIKNGIKVLPQTQFSDLKMEAKILGIGIGLEPDVSWLRDSGLKIEKGIIVNEKLETNLPNIYALGDIAEVLDTRSGRNRIMGTWAAAQTQGRIAARNVLGREEKFDQITISSMNLLGLDVVFLGDTSREWADEIKVEGSKEEGGVVQVFCKNQKILGATFVNRNLELVKLRKALEG